MTHRPMRWIGWTISTVVFWFFLICAQPPFPDDARRVSEKSSARLSSSMHEETLQRAVDDVLVKCELNTPFDVQNTASARGALDITVHRGIAPLASNAFLDMVASKHFDHNYTFRAVEGFVVQWGIETDSNNNGRRRKFANVDIDPPPTSQLESTIRSNVRGSLNFAGGSSASGQVYVNRGTNSHLDKEPGSLPFATLDENSMSKIDSIYSYKEGLGEVAAVKKGDAEVKRLFPRMSMIEKCWIDKS
ncbi:hypothetical protein ACHAXH_005995 [Discostella pseudostelligera]